MLSCLRPLFRILLSLALLPLAPAGLLAQATAPATLDVRDYGAIPDDDRDDSGAIQAAIDAARNRETITFPPGVFLVGRSLDPRGFHRTLQGATKLRWDGDRVVADAQTILKSTGEHFLFHFVGEHASFRNLTFHGRAFFCARTDGSMVNGLVIDNCWFHLDVTGQKTNAIEFTTGLAHSRITNCVFDPIKGDNGIYGYNWKKLTIASNHFLNGNEGIHVIAHWDPSSDLLVEQNYFAGLHRMAIEIQGGGVNTIVQDNFYEKPDLSEEFGRNHDTFAYSIVSDRSQNTRVRRNTSLAPQRPDGVGVRIIFELGGQGVVCHDNYSVAGNHVIAANGSNATGMAYGNRISGYREGPRNSNGAALKFNNNGPDVKLSWDINRGKPGPNKRWTIKDAAP